MTDGRWVQLSRGTRQLLLRFALSGTAADPILLDEPWEGLDPAGRVADRRRCTDGAPPAPRS